MRRLLSGFVALVGLCGLAQPAPPTPSSRGPAVAQPDTTSNAPAPAISAPPAAPRASIAESARGYGSIPDRNAFGLKNPAPVSVQETNVVDVRLPKVSLGGITTILGTKQALLTVVPPEAKSMEDARLPILSEGQKDGAVEVKKIDEKAGTVEIVNSGKPMTITFEETPPALFAGTNLLASSRLGFPATAGSSAGVLGSNLPPASAFSRAQGSAAGLPQFRGRGYTPGGSTSVVPSLTGSSTSTVPPVAVPGTTTIPAATTTTLTPAPNLTPEERAVLQEVETQIRQQETPQQPQPAAQAVVPPPVGTSREFLYQQAVPGAPPVAPPRLPTQPFPITQ